MEKWEDLIRELLSDHSARDLKESLRILYDSYVALSDGGVKVDVHHKYRKIEIFLEKIEEEKIITSP